MTTEHQASRTLVKSPPELWAECSDAGSLARHIGEFGEIRITRLEPETSVSWEAEHATGTVEIEPSGWGTRVTLTAQTKAGPQTGAGRVISEPAAVDVAVVDPGVDAEEGAGDVDAEVDPAGVAAEEEANPVIEAEAGVVPQAGDPPAAQPDPVEEEADAKVEETTAEPDPAVAIHAGPAGGRWKRLIARTRVWFGTSGRVAPAPAEVAPLPGMTADLPDPSPEALSPPLREALSPPESGEVDALDLPPPGLSSTDPPDPPCADEPAEEADGAPLLDPDAVLIAALDSLGQAHHRPFSRA